MGNKHGNAKKREREARLKNISPFQSNNSIDHYLNQQNTLSNLDRMNVNIQIEEPEYSSSKKPNTQSQLYSQDRLPTGK